MTLEDLADAARTYIKVKGYDGGRYQSEWLDIVDEAIAELRIELARGPVVFGKAPLWDDATPEASGQQPSEPAQERCADADSQTNGDDARHLSHLQNAAPVSCIAQTEVSRPDVVTQTSTLRSSGMTAAGVELGAFGQKLGASDAVLRQDASEPSGASHAD